MRIANKISRTGLLSSGSFAALVLTFGLFPFAPVLAANPPMPVMPMVAHGTGAAQAYTGTATPPPLPAAAPSNLPAANSVSALPGTSASPVAAAPLMPATAPSSGDMTKNITMLEDKATDNAKSIMKSLDGTDTLTLDDLNRARQTVSRIDAMIEVEKRLGELQKLRDARNGGSASSLAGAIPASALSPIGKRFGGIPASDLNSGIPAFNPSIPVVARVTSSATEVSRIVGSDGKYAALIKSDGTTRTVHVGDQLNGGTVRWITSSAVGLDEKGQTRTLRVKNIDLVTSAMR